MTVFLNLIQQPRNCDLECANASCFKWRVNYALAELTVAHESLLHAHAVEEVEMGNIPTTTTGESKNTALNGKSGSRGPASRVRQGFPTPTSSTRRTGPDLAVRLKLGTCGLSRRAFHVKLPALPCRPT